MESKNFQQLEDENLQDDIFRTNSQNDLDKLVLEMKDKVGKTDNDLGTGSKKSGGNFFSKLWAKMFGEKPKDISSIEIELNEIANDPLFADDGEGQKEKNKKGEIKKDDKEEKEGEEQELACDPDFLQKLAVMWQLSQNESIPKCFRLKKTLPLEMVDLLPKVNSKDALNVLKQIGHAGFFSAFSKL